MGKKINHLGGLSAKQFLRDYWQKKPLLIRKAFADFVDPLSVKEVLALGSREEAESRLITRRGRQWTLAHGPFGSTTFRKLGMEKWTVLIQDTQHFSFEAQALLAQFNFIPHARIDDVMVSYARPGAGVGPHVDSYDVFLLQGQGKRRWQISSQRDLSLVEHAPLKLLKHFKPEQEWVLERGDMLYLPPGYSHNGIAETECLTWSIGFRAPSHQEWATAFLDYLRDDLKLDGWYQDPDLQVAAHPGEISAQMIKRIKQGLDKIRWGPMQLQTFMGCYLTEPKSHVSFDAPDVDLTVSQLSSVIRKAGIGLDLKSRLLFYKDTFFINGEVLPVPAGDALLFQHLADSRALAPAVLSKTAAAILHACFRNGYLALRSEL